MKRNSCKATPYLAVVIATCEREALLLERCLPSIASQTRKPDRVIVINDGNGRHRFAERVSEWGERNNIVVTFTTNTRKPGASGAWNTAIQMLAAEGPLPGNCCVAFLDDDDAWASDHLSEVSGAFEAGALWCATGFERIQEKGRRAIRPPSTVAPEDFLIGNPGIQGSNLAVDLGLLQMAGGFDEALAACTDRDLCIRLSRVAPKDYRPCNTITVQHFACSDRQRLSSFGDKRRLAGLAEFERKHSAIMSPATLKTFRERAERFFGYRPPAGTHGCPCAEHAGSVSENSELAPDCPLIIGFIADDARREEVRHLLLDILHMQERLKLASLKTLILANGPRGSDGATLGLIVDDFRERGLSIDLLHAEDLEPVAIKSAAGCLPIAEARNLLQSALYRLARRRPTGAVWVLDDDMRLDPLVLRGGRPVRDSTDVLTTIASMKEAGIDIGIGQYTGAPPLPFLATMRLQLLDLIWNIRRLEALPPETLLPDCEAVEGGVDFYHDLSAVRSDHLETPRAALRHSPEETAGGALRRILSDACSILTGSFPTRHLFMGGNERLALHRGGNTLILDIEALRDIPNLSPLVGGRSTRRADMIWAWQQEVAAGRTVAPVPLGVFHDRSRMTFCKQAAITAMIDDIRGHIVQACLRDRAEGSETSIELLMGRYRRRRCEALQASLKRIEGLVYELARWRLTTPLEAADLFEIDALLEALNDLLSENLYTQIEQAIDELTPQIVEAFEEQLSASRQHHQASVDSAFDIDTLLEVERVANARIRLCRVSEMSDPIRLDLLGTGAEGVVFTDHEFVYKVFDGLSPKEIASTVCGVSRLDSDGEGERNGQLCQVELVHAGAGQPVLRYRFEALAPYEGGCGPGLVELLIACHRRQIVCRNIHPKNLRLRGEQVVLIDYGRDTVSVDDPTGTDQEFIRMCRKAYLVWRWAWRSDLDHLLRASLSDARLPELEGFGRFLSAVRRRAGIEAPEDPVVKRAMELQPARILDFGCGKGEQAEQFAAAGIETVAYDPDRSLAGRFSGGPFKSDLENALALGPFDLVICRRVACTLDGEAFDSLLAELRRSVSAEGRVLLAVCHPVYARQCVTPEAAPCCCEGHQQSWQKRMHESGAVRTEFHRPEHVLRRAVQRSGFHITHKYERETVDLERFEPIADLLVLELLPAQRPESTLMIKACAMEGANLTKLVRHQVSAIEAGGGIAETILVLDDRIDGFPRCHADPDIDELCGAAQELLREGWIDRIIHPPTGGDLRALNERWFGESRSDTHAGNGAQLAITLSGFEACRTLYVLHLDADIMIGRRTAGLSALDEMLHALQQDDLAVTAAFPIAREHPAPWSKSSDGKAWRVESRAGLVDLERLNDLLPLPCTSLAPLPALHRALDARIQDGSAHSLRGGMGQTFFVHPPNAFKQDVERWDLVRNRIEHGTCPASQMGNVEWDGSVNEWLTPSRDEPVIFLIGGRNVQPSRMRRCFASLLAQRCTDWGAIVLDDASDSWLADELKWLCDSMGDRITLLRRNTRQGLLANMDLALRRLCDNPESVIVTLDLDDALIGNDVLDRVIAEYTKGADLTVGSMLRTDKPAPCVASFSAPRTSQGGNVWQHLRTFRQYLWNAIPDAYLKLGGRYVDLANDWAYMLALCELASNPVHIEAPLYLHEPSGSRSAAERAKREAIVARLCGLPSLKRLSSEASSKQLRSAE